MILKNTATSQATLIRGLGISPLNVWCPAGVVISVDKGMVGKREEKGEEECL